MPIAPRRPCPGSPRCPHFAGACPVHPMRPGRSGWQQRPSSAAGQRMRGGAWMAIRQRVLAEEGSCYRCGFPGQRDDIVDHVQPLVDGGTDDRSNLHRCCRRCSAQKTAQESARARR